MKRDSLTPDATDDLARQIAALSPAKRALLDLRLKQQNPGAPRQTIPRRTERSSAPLSFAQQRLWFLDQLETNSAVYNLHSAWRLAGGLNVDALGLAVDTLVARHETLRSSFGVVDGQPILATAAASSVRLPIVDLEGLSSSGRGTASAELVRTEANLSFDLAQGPLLRMKVLRLAEEDHVLMLTLHHIVADGWSVRVLQHELGSLYAAFSIGQPSTLADLPIQYADFAEWQRQWLQGEELDTQLTYWKQQLAGFPVVELPTDRPRPAVQTYRGAHEPVRLPKGLTEALKELSKQERATLFMTLLAALKVLLARYTGQHDIVVGSVIANREHVELEPLVGMLANTLALRTDLRGDPSFRGLLGRVRAMSLGAYTHQDLPFEKLVEELQPERDLSRNPLFQVAFTWQNVPDHSLALGDLIVTPFPPRNTNPLTTGNDSAKFDLTLSMIEGGSGIEGIFEYSTDLFDPTTIRSMASHFQTMLEGIVANPEKCISDLPLLTDTERHRLLVEWNDTQTDYPKDLCLHELFEAQVERTPEAVAVVFPSANSGQVRDEQVTYRELNQRANRLAHHLRVLGGGPEVRMGIMMERSVEMVVGLLGVLKAGGAYVPLDPSYPRERLSFMLKDSCARLLLTQDCLTDTVPEYGGKVVSVDRDQDAIKEQDGGNVASELGAESLAYMDYTSGSTGQPKGVLITHRGVSRLLFGVDYVHLDERTTCLQQSSVSFDLATFEVWGPLLHGGRCVLHPERVPTPQGLGEVLGRCEVNTLWLTASLFNLVVDETPAVLGGVEQLLIGGEALSVTHVVRGLEQLPSTQIINGYGPTEATTFACCFRVPAQLEEERSSIPLGGPIANTQVYLLDGHGQPLPVAVAGEVHIGGVGVGRGYFGQGTLTAENFIPDPFCKEAGGRLYRTGDLSRYLANGDLEFLGRLDHQVKVRGFRIELGEIEAVLAAHPKVRDAVVVTRPQPEEGSRQGDAARRTATDSGSLVAYLVPVGGAAPRVSELRDFLAERLPEYMVPQWFVALETLPVTPNGKVDRKGLPAVEAVRPESAGGYAAPRTPVEEMLAGIFSAVLGVEQVGIHDNFFELGGHSLLATQVISRVNGAFDVTEPLRDLFGAPTVAELAESVLAALSAERRPTAPPLEPVARSGDLPLSFAQQRLWFLNQLAPESFGYHVPYYLRSEGPLRVSVLKACLEEIVGRHETLHTRFIVKDGVPFQVIFPQSLQVLSQVDLREVSEGLREALVEKLIGQELRRLFDLSQGPLLRVMLVRVGEAEYVWLLTMHHIVSDGWSMGILVKELMALYEAFARGRSFSLPDLPIQYADFSVWQREWIQGAVREKQLSYWKGELERAPAVLELPTDRQRPALQTFDGARQMLVIPEALYRSLEGLSQREGVTLFMTLVAAFEVLLCRWTGQDDFVVGSPIANRNRSEVEGLIGFFVNMMCLRAVVSGDPQFTELLARVKEESLRAYANQDIPFEQLMEELGVARDLSHTPLFQVTFALQNAPREALELPGLSIGPVRPNRVPVRYDLEFGLWAGAEGLTAEATYNIDLFNGATIERMLGHYRTLLAGIVANPEQHISDLPLLTHTERHQLLVEWNDTGADYPKNLCLHELFELQVERTPEAVALVYEEAALTYRELNRRTNQLAHYLRALGVGRDVLVGICMERSLEMVVGVLGILKAGGAYVPLDPEYPQERLAFMLEDTQTPVLLTQQRVAAKVPVHKAVVVCLDGGWEAISKESSENPISGVTADNVAYVIYTSGSTGRPKGILTGHRAICNQMLWIQEHWPLAHDDRVAQKTSFSFDGSLWEIFRPLLVGARIIMIRPGGHRDSGYLREVIIHEGITMIQFVPSMLSVFLAQPGLAACHGLRQVLCGGEALSFELQQRFFGCLQADLLHLYGPTEASISATGWTCERRGRWGIVPLGQPVANTQIYLLGRHWQPVPVGVAGELHISGDALARGYLNQPELTAEKFIANPLSRVPGVVEADKPGERLYETGDLARYLSDGNMEFLGRVDHQVKIRGFRIELGEIEAVLSEHPAVRETVVLAREDKIGRRLVAYLILNQGPKPLIHELHGFLEKKLPDYMVPAAFVTVDTFPLTPNGKVDRAALPEPGQTRPDLEGALVLPRTQAEGTVAAIWQEVLNLETVGIHDNFFDLGGHSLLATQVLSRLRNTFQIDLPLRTLFESTTVATLTESIETVRWAMGSLPNIPGARRVGDEETAI